MKVCVTLCPEILCIRKMYISGVSFGRLLYCLPDRFLSLWVLYPGSKYFFRNSIFWNLHQFKINLIDLGGAM